MIIDAHTHIDKVNDIDWKVEHLLASMKEARIQCSLVISTDLDGSSVDKIVKIVKKHPQLRAIGHIEYQRSNKAQINSLIQHLRKKHINGVKLYPGYQNYYPFDKKLAPLFSYCEKNNHPIVIHTGILMVGEKGYMEQAHPLHVDRLASDYPKLKIVMAHMGNPWLLDAIAVMWRNQNVYADLSGFFVEFHQIDPRQSAYFVKQMKEVRELLGNFKRLIFGTDWPLYSQKEYLRTVKQIPMSAEEKELVFWKNANDVYNLGLRKK